jgi:hypothetical protein
MAGLAHAAPHAPGMSKLAKSLLTESMDWMDVYYDPSAGYLYDFSGAVGLTHETRSSAWYALGLLARNKGRDKLEADKILRNVISGQYKNPADEW